MSFFDDKQEVLKIELTPYGKNLLARGNFKPTFYSFHDDEILYDITYAGASELQHSASTRIMEETIYLKPQGRLSSTEETKKKLNPADETTDNNLFLTILGNSSLNSDYRPAWNLNFLKGNISSSANLYTGSTVQNLPIPQINLKDITFNLKTKTVSEDKSPLDFKFLDGTAVSLERDFILMELQELNVDQADKNFEIEIFQVETSGSRELLNKINFPPESKNVINDILLDEPSQIMTQSERERTKFVLADNYFTVTVDEEVDLEALLGSPQEALAPEREITTKPPYGEEC
jgi:hypothetical protein